MYFHTTDDKNYFRNAGMNASQGQPNQNSKQIHGIILLFNNFKIQYIPQY